MAKDRLGHGSNKKGTGAQGMRLVKTHVLGPHSAKVYKNAEWGEHVVKTFRNGVYQPKNDYHTDDVADANGTATSQLRRWGDQDAASQLASGAKSATVPIHDSMGTPRPSDNIQNAGGRHGYSPSAVDAAIASSNRAGRKIGGREAKMIHALLKGR